MFAVRFCYVKHPLALRHGERTRNRFGRKSSWAWQRAATSMSERRGSTSMSAMSERRGSTKGKQQRHATVGGAPSSDMELKRAEQAEAIGFLKQQSWMHEDHITRLKADAAKESQMFSEELRLFNEERATAEAAAAHENRMLRLELDRLREETRATRHAKRQNADLSHARWEAERKLNVHEETAAEESAKLQRRFMDLQGLLESQFRQSLKGLRADYRAAALEEVGEEAAEAIRECASLRQQTEEQRDVIHETLRRHDAVKAQRDEKRRDLELQQQAGQLLTSNAAQYRRQLKQLTSMAETAQQAALTAQLEGAATAAQLRSELDEHRARADSLEEAYAAERKESAHWRRTALLYMDPDAAAEAAAAEAEAGALKGAAEQAPPPPPAVMTEAGPVAVAEIAARYDNYGRLIGPDALPDQLEEMRLEVEREDNANVDLDAIWKAPANAAVGGFSPGGGGGGRPFQMARPPRKAAALAHSRPASAASSPARPASAAPASRGGGSGFGAGAGLLCCGAQAQGVDRPASAAPSVCAAGRAARGGAACSLSRTTSAPATGLAGAGGAFGCAASRSPEAAGASRVPSRPGTAGGGVRHATMLGTGGTGGTGGRPPSAMRSAHTGSRPASPAVPSSGASAAAATTTRLARPASAAALPGRRDCDAFSLLRPMPATGAGALPRSAAELAARRRGDGRPASAQVRTCGGGFRANGKQHSRISRERYFVPPPSRVTCQEGTTLFFVK